MNKLEALIAQRPSLNNWLDEYARIEREFEQHLLELGMTFAPFGQERMLCAPIKERLREKGACFRNGDASIAVGALSSACVACTGGSGSKTFTLSSACNRSCYFCFNANQSDYAQTRSLKTNWQAELDEFLNNYEVSHVALTGGEPLLHKKEALAFFTRAHTAFPDAHLRLYTDGDFLDEATARQLSEAGLTELRLSVKLDVFDTPEETDAIIAQAIERVKLAKQYIAHVMVEMPVIPRTEAAMKRLLCELDAAGAFGINLLEFGFPMHNWQQFARRGFALANPLFAVSYNYGYAAGLPVAGSERACLELLEYAQAAHLNLGVHYCSLENKHRDQVLCQNSRARLDARIWELDANDFFYKSVKVFDEDVALVREALEQLGFAYTEDARDASLQFAPQALECIAELPVIFALSYNILEEDANNLLVRELKLEPMKDYGLLKQGEEEYMNDTENAWLTRAAACEFAAFSLRYPTAELAEALISGEWAAAAEEFAACFDQEVSAELSAGLHCFDGADAREVLEGLRVEATRLFVGSPKPEVSPFEGVWRAADDGVDALLFVNPHSMDVERFCRACGLGRPEGTNEPLDFVATEFELLQYLASLEAGIAKAAENAPENKDLPVESAGAAYETFMQEHIMTWVPRFALALTQQAQNPFYQAFARYLELLLPALQ